MRRASKIEVVVHIDDALNEDQRLDFVSRLRGCDGVEHASFTPGHQHLLLVDYDRDQLNALDVLGYVGEFQKAELVGPI